MARQYLTTRQVRPVGSMCDRVSLSIDGSYRPTVIGRFTDQDTDAVLWYRPGGASEDVWSYDGGGYSQSTLNTGLVNTNAATGCLDPSDVD